ncbi:MAG: FG-GAP-like repeat-containing protein [Fuerstiella sp.]
MSRFRHQRTSPDRWAVFVFCILGFGLSAGCGKTEPTLKRIGRAKVALARGDFSEAESLASSIPSTDSRYVEAQLIAGEACSKDDRFEDAVDHYESASLTSPESKDGLLAVFSIAEIRLQQAKLSDAERLYQQVCQQQPGNLAANERLAFLYSLTARRWEALPYYFVMIQGGECDYNQLALAADVGRAIEQPEFLAQCLERNPTGVLVRLAVAFRRAEEGQRVTIDELQRIVNEEPRLFAAQAMLGQLLLESGDDSKFVKWHSQLPAAANDSPDIWFTRGQWARRSNHPDVAADCFLHAVKLCPFHRQAFYLLGQSYTGLKSPHAAAVVNYAERLIQLTQVIDKVLTSEGFNYHAVRKTAELLESTGRIWEACAWAVMGRELRSEGTWHSEILDRRSDELASDLPWVAAGYNPIDSVQLTDFDFDVWLRQQAMSGGLQVVTQDQNQSVIQFSNGRQIDFVYSNADDPETAGLRMFEQTGGGVGILDLENNGVPDVYLTQGSPWENGSDAPTVDESMTDQIYRIVLNDDSKQAFRKVPASVTAGTSDFGQGCTVGDFNNDGIDDVYVANIGQNRLLEGMGDGTFLDVTAESGISDDSWTVSVMSIDLNADGYVDLFDVNYVEGPDVYTRICNGESCGPSAFDGAADRIWMGRGDGTFQPIELPTPSSMAKGLGIVSFEGPNRRRPSVFIANDQVANFLLTNEPSGNQWNLQLSNSALLTGLAYNENGVAMACMGIAVDDFDSNNMSDLFVTNFQDEPNTLYLQDAPGLFRDSTRTMGLYAGSLSMTGWGTQALDADLDGRPDLMVVNGHVDDNRNTGGSFRMKPQFYHGKPDRFQLLEADQLGPWFADQYLGRGMARVDWNMDGRPEFIASLMNQPAGVLQNSTTGAGHFLKLKLSATTTARDAIGALATIKTKDRTMTRQLYGGGGYMASNERVITFGLGSASEIESIDIDWPSGAHSILQDVEVDQFYLVTEAATSAVIHSVEECRAVAVVTLPSKVDAEAAEFSKAIP